MNIAVKRILLNISVGLGFSAALLAQPTYNISTVMGTYSLTDTSAAAPVNNPMAVAVDGSGNVYFTDTLGNRVRKIDATGAVTTVAGDGTFGVNGVGGGGPAVKAKLWQPSGLALDTAGNLYIADSFDHVIEKVDSSGVLTVFAGTSNSGSFAGDGKLATLARLRNPQRLATDSTGVVYIADKENNRIRKVTPDGMIHTIAGLGGNSTTTAHAFSGDGGPAVEAGLGQPQAVAVDSAGNVYIADTANNRVRMINVADIFGNPLKSSTGTVLNDSSRIITTVAGGGTAPQLGSSTTSTPTLATLSAPAGLAVDSQGNVYISDTGNNRIMYLNFNRNAGCTSVNNGCAQTNPVLTTVLTGLSTPEGIALSGTVLYIAEAGANRIRSYDVSSGNSVILTSPQINPFVAPKGLSVDATGNIWVADTFNNRISEIAPTTGAITRIAGTGSAGFPTAGGDDNPTQPLQAVNSKISAPWGGAFDAIGNFYFADRGNNRVRMITPLGVITTIAGGNNSAIPPTGFAKPPTVSTAAGYFGDGLPAAQSQLRNPSGVAVDNVGLNGNCAAAPCIYIADTGNNVVRQINALGIISTFAGTQPSCATGSPNFSQTTTTTTTINTTAGTGGSTTTTVSTTTTCAATAGGLGDGLAANESQLSGPLGVAVDSKGNVYIADTNNHEIRIVTTDGNINAYSGYAFGEGGHAGDGGLAINSQDDQPVAVAVDNGGNVFFAEGCSNFNSWGQCENSRIRRVDAATGFVTTLTAGVNAASLSTGTFAGDGAAATKSLALIPSAIAVDAAGNVYFADVTNRLRKLTPVPASK
jgi:sugar lactone lactonase YvrE